MQKMIKSINIKNIYSFGDQGTFDLSEFGHFNLFIGKNGAGKTSVFRVLKSLEQKIEYNPLSVSISEDIFNKSIPKYLGGTHLKDKRKDRNVHISLITEDIIFKDSKYKQGDYSKLQDSVSHIVFNSSFTELTKRLQILSSHPDREILLSFAFYFVFGKIVKFQNGNIGEFYNGGYKGGGRHVHLGFANDKIKKLNSCFWSSGYVAATSILLEFLLLGNNILKPD